MPAAGFAFQAIERAAIGARRIAARLDGQVDARVRIPVCVLRHRAVQGQVALGDHDDALGVVLPLAHADLAYLTGVSPAVGAAARPCTQSKYIACSLAVMGPRVPSPIARLSSSRIGVTSAAVPVKNASSAMYTSSRVMRFSTTLMPSSPAACMMVARGMPSSAGVRRGG